MASPESPPPTEALTRLAVVAVCIGVAVVGFTTTAITVGTRGIADELDVSLRTLGWIVNAYLLTAAALVLIGGRLGDVLGRVHTFVLGALVFAAGSTLGALAPGYQVLIVARCVQGAGAALLLPAGIEVIASFSARGDESRGFGARSMTYASSFAIGPLLGGLLTDHLNWRLIFVAGLLGAAVAAVAALPLLHRSTRGTRRPTHDWRGAILVALLAFVVVAGAERSRVWSFKSWPFVAMIGLAVLLTGLLIVVERSTEHPLVHPALLRDRRIQGANLATFGASLGMVGLLYFFNIFAQSAALFDATIVAVLLALAPFVVTMIVFVQLSHWLSHRLGFRGPALLGMGLMDLGFFALSFTTAGTTKLELAVPLLLCGVGAGVANAGLTGPAVLGLPRGRLNEAAGLVSLTRFLGSAVALAVGTSAYLSVTIGQPAAMQASGSSTSDVMMGGNAFHLAVAQLDRDLQGPFRAAVQADTARAFAATMQVTALVLLVVFLGTAWLLRPDVQSRQSWRGVRSRGPAKGSGTAAPARPADQ